MMKGLPAYIMIEINMSQLETCSIAIYTHVISSMKFNCIAMNWN